MSTDRSIGCSRFPVSIGRCHARTATDYAAGQPKHGVGKPILRGGGWALALLFAVTNQSGCCSMRRLQEPGRVWETQQYRSEIRAIEANPDTFIALGIGSGHTCDKARRDAEWEAGVRLTEHIGIYVTSATSVYQEVFGNGDTPETREEHESVIVTFSRGNFRDIEHETISHIVYGDRYHVAVFAKINKITFLSDYVRLIEYDELAKTKEYLDQAHRRFVEILRGNLPAGFAIPNSEK